MGVSNTKCSRYCPHNSRYVIFTHCGNVRAGCGTYRDRESGDSTDVHFALICTHQCGRVSSEALNKVCVRFFLGAHFHRYITLRLYVYRSGSLAPTLNPWVVFFLLRLKLADTVYPCDIASHTYMLTSLSLRL